MAASPLRAYWHQQHLDRVKRMVPPPKPRKMILLPHPVGWAILYNEPIGPVAPEIEPILTLAEYLGTLPPIRPMPPTLRRIQIVVAAYYKIGLNELTSSRRSQNLIPPRFAYYHLAKTLTRHSLVEIGRRCGGRDHATVDNGLKRLKSRWETYAPDITHLMSILDPASK